MVPSPADHLVHGVVRGAAGLGGDPGVHGQGAAPVEGACRVNLHHGLRRAVRIRCHAGTGSIRRSPILIDIHVATGDRQYRARQQRAQDHRKPSEPPHECAPRSNPAIRPRSQPSRSAVTRARAGAAPPADLRRSRRRGRGPRRGWRGAVRRAGGCPAGKALPPPTLPRDPEMFVRRTPSDR